MKKITIQYRIYSLSCQEYTHICNEPSVGISLEFMIVSHYKECMKHSLSRKDGHAVDLGTRIRTLRTKKKLSQTELGNLVSVHYTQIGRYEKGESRPSLDVLRKLSKTLEVDIDFLMEGTVRESTDELISDQELLKLFKKIEEFDENDKRVVKILLDAFVVKKQLQQLAR